MLAALGTLAPAAHADDFRVDVAGSDSLELRVRVDYPDLFPGFVLDRLERGIPATVGFQIELWRDRGIWFDANMARWVHDYKITRDPWTGSYVVASADTSFAADSLSIVVDRLAEIDLALPLEPEWVESDSKYRVAVVAVVIPLSASDLGEVEDWLTGEFGGGGLLSIPKGLFNIVRDLSGLGDRKAKAQSVRFRISRLGSGVLLAPLHLEEALDQSG